VASGQVVNYLAPTAVPSGGTVTIAAASTANPTVSISQSVAITPSLSPVALQGTVMAGTLPVVGAQVQLYEAGNTGYGSTATPLQFTVNGSTVNSVTTGQNGNFSIPAGYSCTNQNSLLYLVAQGGNPGGIGVNPELGLMTALGPCSNLNSSLPIIVNEVTTVASVWPLARFIGSSFADIGSSNSNYNTGFANAFATVNNLASITLGQSALFSPGGGAYNAPASRPTTISNGLVPQAEINTLADAIDTCAASTGGVPGDGSPCDKFFAASNTNPLGGVPNTSNEPTSILQAVIEDAQYPGRSGENGEQFPFTGSALFDLIPAQGYPFSPILQAPPSDWTIALSFSGGGLEGVRNARAQSSSLAIDGSGNVWISNEFISSVTELTNLGVSLSPFATGFQVGTGGGFTAGGLSNPLQLAVDQNGSVWVLNSNSGSGSSVTELDFEGAAVTCPGSAYCGGSSASTPFVGAGNLSNNGNGLFVDGSGNVWVAESGSPGDVAEYAGFNGLQLNGNNVKNGGAISPAGSGYTSLASASDPLDTAPPSPNGALGGNDSGGVWLLDGANYAAVELSSSGALKEVDHGFTGVDPSTGQPTAPLLSASTFGNTLAIDRAGDLYIPQTPGGEQIYELYSCGSSSDPNCLGLGTTTLGAMNPSLNSPLAMDGSQNIWMLSTECGACAPDGSSIPGSLIQISPSGTPLNLNSSTPQTGYQDPCSTSGCAQLTSSSLTSIAVDSSGNIWLLITQPGQPVSVVEFVGVGTPVITPVSSALTAGKLAAAP
jgi:hypothetical protein